VLVKHKLIPFKCVFDLIPFPVPFWEKSNNFRDKMREYWIKDFWTSFEYLNDKYYEENKKRGYTTSNTSIHSSLDSSLKETTVTKKERLS
jgi:hypothetical protein